MNVKLSGQKPTEFIESNTLRPKIKPKLKAKTLTEVDLLRNEITDIKNVLNVLVNNLTIQNVQQIQTQNIQNLQNNNINIVINFGEEGKQSELCKKLDMDLDYVVNNHVSNCVPILSKIMHDGEKYPEYQNIYATDQFPNSVFIWKNGQFIKTTFLKKRCAKNIRY